MTIVKIVLNFFIYCTCSIIFTQDFVTSQSYFSPCPDVFQFVRDRSDNVLGQISIDPPKNEDIVLKFTYSVDRYTEDSGKIELVSNTQQIFEKVTQGKRIKFLVFFSESKVIPTILEIKVNEDIVCRGNPAQSYFGVTTNVTLSFVLTFPKILFGKNPTFSLRGDQDTDSLVQPSLGAFSYNNQKKTPNRAEDSYNNQPFIIGTNFVRENTFTENPTLTFINNYQTGKPNFNHLIYNTHTITTTSPTPRRRFKPENNYLNPFEAVPNDKKFPLQAQTWSSPKETPSSTISKSFSNSLKATTGCGTPGSVPLALIAGGTSIMNGEFPWLVAIFMRKPSLSGYFFDYTCCGSLVSEKHVVTAAHCMCEMKIPVDKENLYVTAGEMDLTKSSAIKNSYSVRHYLCHPQYVSSAASNQETKVGADIAVLTLETSVVFTDLIRPICLWSEDNNFNEVVSQSGKVVGWGKNEKGKVELLAPKQVSIPIVNQKMCLDSSTQFSRFDFNTSFCAGSRDNTGPCQGDSGSGFIIHLNGKWTLLGVVSHALSNLSELTCDLKQYIVFTNVSKYITWINDQILSL